MRGSNSFVFCNWSKGGPGECYLLGSVIYWEAGGANKTLFRHKLETSFPCSFFLSFSTYSSVSGVAIPLGEKGTLSDV